MICDGCWVQGDGSHECAEWARAGTPSQIHCICSVEPSCWAWKPIDADRYQAPGSRFDRA